MTRRSLLGVLLMVGLLLAWSSVEPTQAQIPPPPTLPAPPEEGNAIADIVGPAITETCSAAAVAYALAGPIVSEQIPAELQPLISELEPWLGTALVVCGYLITPPSGIVCDADQGIVDQFASLGVPMATPPGAQVFHDTVAGIEDAFIRAGVPIDRAASQALAEALGCRVPEPPVLPPPAVAPTQGLPSVGGSTESPGPASGLQPSSGAFSSTGQAPLVPDRIAAPAPALTTEVAGLPATPAANVPSLLPLPGGLFRYPIAFLVPLLLMVGVGHLGRVLSRPVGSRR